MNKKPEKGLSNKVKTILFAVFTDINLSNHSSPDSFGLFAAP